MFNKRRFGENNYWEEIKALKHSLNSVHNHLKKWIKTIKKTWKLHDLQK